MWQYKNYSFWTQVFLTFFLKEERWDCDVCIIGGGERGKMSHSLYVGNSKKKNVIMWLPISEV